MNLYWTEEAQQRLQDIQTYIAEDSSVVAAETTRRLVERIGRLIEHPAIGHRLSDYPNFDVRELMLRPYRIVYEVKSDRILILTILHYRQLVPKHLV